MKNKIFVGLTALLLGTGFASQAHAGVSIQIGLPLPPLPRIYLPGVVIAPPAPCPPPVVYAPPAVVCRPPVAHCAPPVVYGVPYRHRYIYAPHRHGYGYGHRRCD